MSNLLFLSPVFKNTIWGGKKIKSVFGFDCSDRTGECWTIAAHKNGMNTIVSGTFKGQTLSQLWKENPEIFGNEDGHLGEQFPLMVKIIDAKKDLSIQVHPDDDYAREHEKGSLGKMECWYVLDCEEKAKIVIGHKAKSKKEMEKMIAEKKWDQFLREIPVKKGDFFQINPGCIHAIKGGTVILETQQSSDITYRVYDYDRLQNGKKRKLHLEKSMDVITVPFKNIKVKPKKFSSDNVDLEHFIKCSKYTVEKYSVHGTWKHNFRAPFSNLTIINGRGIIDGNTVQAGQSVIVPGKLGGIVLEGEFEAICSWPEFEEKAVMDENIADYTIGVYDWLGNKKAYISDSNQGVLAFKDIYEEGDYIKITLPEKNQFYKIRIDDTMDEELVYVADREFIYSIPFGESRKSYNQKSFCGDRHYLTVRKAQDYEIECYKNLAKNVIDQHGERKVYPHASANVETRGESVFAARNAIDGVIANNSHGSWPYESWGINKDNQAQMCLEFGRSVDFDKIVLYTRADFPHDNWWSNITFEFSDGTTECCDLKKSNKAHVLNVRRKNIKWLKLKNLKKADDPSEFPALTQIEVYGKESKYNGRL